MSVQLPSRRLLELQADWLADARSRLLRLAEIARRKRVLDLGAGYGAITEELRRRTSGLVIALDRSKEVLSFIEKPAVCGNAVQLPFQNATLDLVFSQNVLLWIPKPEDVVDHVHRILISGGVWVLFEPDYGGMLEYPYETVPIWIDALTRAGGDPYIGRRMPSLLEQNGFRSRIELLPRLIPPTIERFDFLEELPLTREERSKVKATREQSRNFSGAQQISHLPYFLIIAERP
jgi:SAM-dependent methyltransferase